MSFVKKIIGSLFKKFRHKYRLVIMDDDTFKEAWSFRLSKMNIFVSLGLISIISIAITAYIIAFTPLREFIPGYTNAEMIATSYKNAVTIDSLQQQIRNYDIMLGNIQQVISGEDIHDVMYQPKADSTKKYAETIEDKRSPQDNALRKEIESEDKYQLKTSSTAESAAPVSHGNIKNMLFFSPIHGTILSQFDLSKQHYGIDVSGQTNETVKAVADGIIIFADWTYTTGYMIGIQHQDNIVSIYKHNSSLLKKIGDFVKAGDPIAFIGNTGELTSGPHLHFELWNNGSPVNPTDYILF